MLLQLFQELREGLRTVEIGGEAHDGQIKILALRLSVQFCSREEGPMIGFIFNCLMKAFLVLGALALHDNHFITFFAFICVSAIFEVLEKAELRNSRGDAEPR